jgi:hypothetical protein
MMSRAGWFGLALGVLSLTSGCVIRRDITDVIAHKDYNNYKIQTISTHWALWVWNTSEVWTCSKKGEGFKCHMVEHDPSLKGFDNGGAKAAPEATPAADAAPAADEGDKK